MKTVVEINGHRYFEDEHGRFEAALIDNGEVIAVTRGDEVRMYRGNLVDIIEWADSYGIEKVVQDGKDARNADRWADRMSNYY